MTAITYEELSNNLDGIHYRKTFEIAFCTTFEDHREEVLSWLADLSTQDFSDYEEVVVVSRKGIPRSFNPFLNADYFIARD